jgi:hypothetical protein
MQLVHALPESSTATDKRTEIGSRVEMARLGREAQTTTSAVVVTTLAIVVVVGSSRSVVGPGYADV